jgi:hypothetical protein
VLVPEIKPRALASALAILMLPPLVGSVCGRVETSVSWAGSPDHHLIVIILLNVIMLYYVCLDNRGPNLDQVQADLSRIFKPIVPGQSEYRYTRFYAGLFGCRRLNQSILRLRKLDRTDRPNNDAVRNEEKQFSKSADQASKGGRVRVFRSKLKNE